MKTTENSETLPVGARELHVDLTVLSPDLAERLSEAGASDKAIDAAGGDGAAEQLRAERAEATAA